MPITRLGTTGNDTMSGDTGAPDYQDRLYGLQGDDKLSGGLDNDTLVGSTGNDSLSGGFNNDSLDGFDGADSVNGDSGNDTITAGEGDDFIVGGLGNDSLDAGGGNDLFFVSSSIDGVFYDTYVGGSGNDTIQTDQNLYLESISGVEVIQTALTGLKLQFSANGNTADLTGVNLTNFHEVDLGAGGDTLTDGADGHYLRGEDGDDLILGVDGGDSLQGDGGADTLDGGAGDDVILFNGSAGGFDNVEGGSGVDVVTVAANGTVIGLHQISGVEAIDLGSFTGVSLSGGAAGDDIDLSGATIFGALTIDAGSGSDLVFATQDADTINGGDGADQIAGGGGDDVVDGGVGTDSVYFSGASTDYSVSIGATVTVTDLRAGAPDGVDVLTNVERLVFTDGYVVVSAGSNTAPSAPADLNGAANSVSEAATVGTVVAGLTIGATDADAGDTIRYELVGDAGGRFAINAETGEVTVANPALLDYETAASHDIQVRAFDGADYSSVTTFTIQVANAPPTTPSDNDPATNTVSENAAGGTVVAGLSVTAPDPHGGSTVFSLTNDAGGRFVINATTGVVSVAMGAVLDYETATSHSITVQASDGLATSSASFTVNLTNVVESQSYTGGSGADTLNQAASGDNWTVIGAAGNDKLTTGGGTDTLTGGAGDDTQDGGAGDDLFLVGGTGDGFDSITGGLGGDTLAATADNTAIGVKGLSGVEVITSGGFNGVTLIGSNSGENLNLAGATLTGIGLIDTSYGSDTVVGSSGGDTIAASFSDDNLSGGDGDDLFLVAATPGVDIYAGGNGADTIAASANSVAIGIKSISGVEVISSGGFSGVTIVGSSTSDTINLTGVALSGIGPIDAGAANDTVVGTAGGESIVGGAGDDSLSGADGDDVFLVATGAGYDAIDGGSGADTIAASANSAVIALSRLVGVEAITANGFTGVTVAGSVNNDLLDFSGLTLTSIGQIDGGSGADTLIGTGGGDTLVGGNSDDSLSGGGGDDVFRYGAISNGMDNVDGGGGSDTIAATANNSVIGLRAVTGVEAITSGGFTGVSLGGTTGADQLDLTGITVTGVTRIDLGSGNDTVVGSGGDDTIVMGAGQDVLTGAGGADVFDLNAASESATAARDVITDFVSGADRIDLATIDASTLTAGDQAFAFIGTAAFSNVAGQLRYDTTDPTKTIVMGDVNGDGAADFQIELTGALTLTSADFVL
jgi:Ca2+-binding RTX toxin-like protein